MRAGLVALAVAVAAACAGPAPGLVIAAPGWRARVSVSPWPPAGLQLHFLVVRFEGTPPPGPVALTVRMPEMTHTAAVVPLRATGPGWYEGATRFEMAGTWELVLRAGRPPQEGRAELRVAP